jgi:predicted regulator of Ras-like GTPase activity (Roadblock/LC7/MglB family)
MVIDSRKIKNIIKRFEEEEGVRGVIICDTEGLPIQSSLDTETAEATAAHITALVGRARLCAESLREGNLNFIRLETARGEVMIAPQEDLILIILRTPS